MVILIVLVVRLEHHQNRIGIIDEHKSSVSFLPTDKNSFLHSYKGSYNALEDRKISLKDC